MDDKVVVGNNYEIIIPRLKKCKKVEFEDVDEDTLRLIPRY